MTDAAIRNERDGRRDRHRLIGFVAAKFVALALIGLYVAFFVV